MPTHSHAYLFQIVGVFVERLLAHSPRLDYLLLGKVVCRKIQQAIQYPHLGDSRIPLQSMIHFPSSYNSLLQVMKVFRLRLPKVW